MTGRVLIAIFFLVSICSDSLNGAAVIVNQRVSIVVPEISRLSLASTENQTGSTTIQLTIEQNCPGQSKIIIGARARKSPKGIRISTKSTHDSEFINKEKIEILDGSENFPANEDVFMNIAKGKFSIELEDYEIMVDESGDATDNNINVVYTMVNS
jgi:hypothetical protein